MKLSIKLYALFLFLLSAGPAVAQEKTFLPVDESGKYTFMEIGTVKALSKAALSANVKRFFKSNSKSLKVVKEEKDSLFSGKGKMVIQKGIGGVGHPSGQADYTISIALKDGKYRLLMTDFVITPYQRDRYGNFVPLAVSTPLERTPDQLGKAEWEANMAFIAAESKKIAARLKTAISTVKPVAADAKKPATISTTEW